MVGENKNNKGDSTSRRVLNNEVEIGNLKVEARKNRVLSSVALAGVGFLTALGVIGYCSINDGANHSQSDSGNENKEMTVDTGSRQEKDSNVAIFDYNGLIGLPDTMTYKDTSIISGKGNPTPDTVVLKKDYNGNIVDTLYNSGKQNNLEKKSQNASVDNSSVQNGSEISESREYSSKRREREQKSRERNRSESNVGLSNKGDPMREKEPTGESFWAFMSMGYDCSGESYSFPRGIEWVSEGKTMELGSAYVSEKPQSYEKMNSNYRRINPSNIFGDKIDFGDKKHHLDTIVSKEINPGVKYNFGKFTPLE